MSEELKPQLKVHGYTAQSQAKQDLVNSYKILEERVLRALEIENSAEISVDPRWRSIAITHIQQGFMAMNRAIFQPKRIALPEDNETPGDTNG